MKFLKAAWLLVCMMSGPFLFAQVRQYVLIVSKGENKLVVLDYKTLGIVAKIPLGEGPHDVVTSDGGGHAYVSVPMASDEGHEIDVINLQTLQPEKILDTRPLYIPHGLACLNGKLWFTAPGSKAVARYDLGRDAVDTMFGTGQDFAQLIQLRPDGRAFYTTDSASGSLSIFEQKEATSAGPRQEWRQTLVHVGAGAAGFDVLPDDKELWIARRDGHIIVVDLDKKEVKADINTQVPGLQPLKVTPDGRMVCVASVKTGDLLFYDRATRRLLHEMNVGRGAGIYMDKGDNRMFLSCTPDNYVVVIDLTTRKEVSRFIVAKPDGITATPAQ